MHYEQADFGFDIAMLRLRTFWQLFATFSLIALFCIGMFSVVAYLRMGPAPVIGTTAAITLLPALALSFWLARRTALPLSELIQGAEQIAGGGYGHKVYADTQDEVGKLARTFNYMSERLATQFAQLDEDRKKLYAVLGSMIEGVVAIDAGQRILFANERAGQLLDFQTRTAVGRRLWELVRNRALQELVEQAVADPQVVSRELSWTAPPARSLAVHIGRLPGKPPSGIVLVFHDISALRRLETVRQEFFANVSHELKTPLSVINACVETLLDGAVDDLTMRSTFLKRISEQAERLHALILDMLSLARIETEAESLSMQPVSLESVVESCLERHRTFAQGKNQQLEVLPPPDASVQAWADEEAVYQILDNLVDNAIKYTPAGGTIRVRWGVDGEQVFIEVSDTGIGIPETALARVFERFYRVDKARSRELGGTGLGLSIVKHLAHAMQGTVEAQSQLGKGSTFLVRLRQAAVAEVLR